MRNIPTARLVLPALCLVVSACVIATGNRAELRLAADQIATDPDAIDAAHPPELKEITAPSHGARMAGRLYLANGAGPHPTVLLLHGFPGTEKNIDLAQALRRGGYNVLIVHYRGSWGSEGEYSIAHVLEDAAAAIEYLRSGAEPRVDTARLIPIGHSMGGFAALVTAAADAELECVGGLAAADGGVLAASFDNADAAKGFAAYTDNLVMLRGASGAAIVKEFRAHRAQYDIRAKAGALAGKAVLLVAARDDAVLPVADFHAPMASAFAANPGIALTATTLGGDHAFSWTRLALARTTLDWLEENCR